MTPIAITTNKDVDDVLHNSFEWLVSVINQR